MCDLFELFNDLLKPPEKKTMQGWSDYLGLYGKVLMCGLVCFSSDKSVFDDEDSIFKTVLPVGTIFISRHFIDLSVDNEVGRLYIPNIACPGEQKIVSTAPDGRTSTRIIESDINHIGDVCQKCGGSGVIVEVHRVHPKKSTPYTLHMAFNEVPPDGIAIKRVERVCDCMKGKE